MVASLIVSTSCDAQGSSSPSSPGTAGPSTPTLATTGPGTTAPSQAVGSGGPSTVQVTAERFVTDLDSPVHVTHAGDGSGLLYVVEQAGRIRIVEPDGTVAAEPFLDIGERISAGGERGLLGLAFHPGYATNGRFFVMYTAAEGGTNTVAEFHADGTTADPGSERILVAIDDFAPNHNGGTVAFGPDAYLYIGTGDGGGAGDPDQNGQRLDALLGKMLRIDVDGGDPYGIPSDNPFVGEEGARPEVWDLGLRNPWRFSFDRDTGDLWIGDVGQGMYEEIDAEPASSGGRNYGWSVMEGPECFRDAGCEQDGLTLPVAWYGREEGCVVVGGHVYRGAAYPALRGIYLYADMCQGTVWGLDAATALAAGAAEPVVLGDTESSLVAFGEDEAGELYAVDLGGAVLRIIASPAQ